MQLANGLVIEQAMTRPTKPGKAPRPIWEVDGPALSAFRDALIELGGRPWKGKITFFEDRCAQIEALGDDDKLSFRERQELAQQRAGERADRLSDRAQAHAHVAETAQAAAHRIMDGIPFGQPILVDHYSARHHRADIARIDRNMRKAIDESSYSQHLDRRAAHAGFVASGEHSKRYLDNRISECEAELRRFERLLAEPGFTESARFLALKAEYTDKLAYWREEMAKLGGVEYDRDSVRPGDLVKVRGRWGTVKSRGPKNVKVTDQYAPWGLSYPYAEIQEHRRPGQEAPDAAVQ